MKTLKNALTMALAASAALGVMATQVNALDLYGWVSADNEVMYTEYFHAGDYVEIYLGGARGYNGRCESDIDLWVYDPYGREFKSTSYDCDEWVSFYASTNGVYEIWVENINKPRGSDFELLVY